MPDQHARYADLRRTLLKVFIGFLSLTALVAIIALLSGDSGHIMLNALATTFSISAGSVCAMSCAALIEKKGAHAWGGAGILSAGIAVALTIVGVWGMVGDDVYWRTAFTSIVVAAAIAHSSLVHLPNLAKRHRWTQTAAAVLIGFLALQITAALWGEIREESFYRLMAALSVLVVLATLVIPICSRLGARSDAGATSLPVAAPQVEPIPEQLVLRRVSGAVFADREGRRYHVTEVEAEPGSVRGPSSLP
jgi:hypothetical protein